MWSSVSEDAPRSLSLPQRSARAAERFPYASRWIICREALNDFQREARATFQNDGRVDPTCRWAAR